MLKIDVNQEKQLTFEVQIGGVQSDQIASHLRIVIDEIEYGFPAHVGNESITVNLPPLRSVTARKLKEGEEVEVKLDIIVDGNYLTPWSDTFRLTNPIVVEAKIMNDEFNKSPAFRTRLIQEGKFGDRKQGVRLEKVEVEDDEDDEGKHVKGPASEDDLTEKIVNKLAQKLAKLREADIDAMKKAEKEEEAAEKKEKTAEKMEDEAEKEEEAAEKKEKAAMKESKKRITPKDVLNITEAGVFDYMRRAGTKNEAVQKIVYEQAEAAAGSSKPVDVLKQVVKILNRK